MQRQTTFSTRISPNSKGHPRDIHLIFRPPSGYCYRLSPGIQGIQSIQANWFHLGVCVVHLLHPNVLGPRTARWNGE